MVFLMQKFENCEHGGILKYRRIFRHSCSSHEEHVLKHKRSMYCSRRMTMLTSLDVAEYFISMQTDDAGDAISNLKLQKLLYYAQGYSLVLRKKPLFEDDFQAWEHGPVIPAIYRRFSKYHSGAIPKSENFSLKKYSAEEREFLDDIYYTYAQFSAWALREMSHQTTPWKEAARNEIISRESMTQFFKTQVDNDQLQPQTQTQTIPNHC